MAEIFHLSMWVYVSLFFVESFTLYLYYYGWERWKRGRAKIVHLGLGVLLNVFGTTVMLIAHGWLTYMMSPPKSETPATLPSEVKLWEALFTRRGCRSTSTGSSRTQCSAARSSPRTPPTASLAARPTRSARATTGWATSAT